MFFPYKAKNPFEKFPAVTLSIIIANCVVFGLTSEGFLVVRREFIPAFGFLSGQTPFYTLVTYIFMHLDIFHIAGNMLFLWVFSGAVEDRLGRFSFLWLYFAAGIIGGLAQDMISNSFMKEGVPIIGASASVMGVMGAYWYMFPWSRVRIFYSLFFFIWRTREIKAFWVIGAYFLLDVFSGTTGMGKGVANFAHVFGMVAGVAYSMIVGGRRDSVVISEAKASQSRANDFSHLDISELMAVVEAEPDNIKALKALMDKAASTNKNYILEKTFAQAGAELIEKAPELVSRYLLDMQGEIKLYESSELIKLAALLRQRGNPEAALGIYQRLVESTPESPDAETAILRMAQIQWNHFRNADAALSFLTEMQERFPQGRFLPYAQALRRDLNFTPR
jgi:membrane associated rhomboid family serine protease